MSHAGNLVERSTNGVLLECGIELDYCVGRPCRLTVAGDSDPTELAINGVVVEQVDNLLRIEFHEPDEASLATLNRILGSGIDARQEQSLDVTALMRLFMTGVDGRISRELMAFCPGSMLDHDDPQPHDHAGGIDLQLAETYGVSEDASDFTVGDEIKDRIYSLANDE